MYIHIIYIYCSWGGYRGVHTIPSVRGYNRGGGGGGIQGNFQRWCGCSQTGIARGRVKCVRGGRMIHTTFLETDETTVEPNRACRRPT